MKALLLVKGGYVLGQQWELKKKWGGVFELVVGATRVLGKTLETWARWRGELTFHGVSSLSDCMVWKAERRWPISHPAQKCSPEVVWDDGVSVQCILPLWANAFRLGIGGGGARGWGFSFSLEGWRMYSSWPCYRLEFPGEIGRESRQARTLPNVRISFDKLLYRGRSLSIHFLGVLLPQSTLWYTESYAAEPWIRSFHYNIDKMP